MRYHIDEHKNYIQKIMTKWQSIYRMAHVATGSSELAEIVLQEALLDAYIHSDDGTLRENMRRAVTDSALAHLKAARKTGHADFDWNGFTIRPDGLSDSDLPLWELLSGQDSDVKRIVTLKYALRWSPRQIADVMGLRMGEVKTKFSRALAQLERKGEGTPLPSGSNVRISPLDRAINRVVRLELARTGDDLPDIAAVMQAFEQDAAAYRRPNITARKFTGGAARVLLVLITAMVFYLCAIMAQNPYDVQTHVVQTAVPDSTSSPVLTLPALGEYEMINAGRQMVLSDLSELEYYFSLPVARLSADGWGISQAYIRDERGIGGTTTRAAVIDYADAGGNLLTVRSMLPGEEACQRLEEDMTYVGSNAFIAGQPAVQIRSGDLSRIYVMINQAVYEIEGHISMDSLVALAGDIVVV